MNHELEHMRVPIRQALLTCISVLTKERDEARENYREVEITRYRINIVTTSEHFGVHDLSQEESCHMLLSNYMRRIKECEVGINALHHISYPALMMVPDDLTEKEEK